eukprot:4959342-Ditylum_brightwellii.AAC.1
MACHISKALAEIHDDGGVVLNNLSVDHIIVNELQNNEDNRDDDSCISVHMISLGSASVICGEISFSGDEKHEKTEVQNDLKSLGEIFFELFSGQCPYNLSTKHNRSIRNQGENISEGNAGSLDGLMDVAECQDYISCDIQTDGEISCCSYCPLKELRSALTKSLVPPYLSLFTLELMGVFGSIESTRYISSDADVDSGSLYYKSAREVGDYLHAMKYFDLNDFSFESVVQDSLTERLDLISKKLYGRVEEQVVLLDAYKRVIENAGECEVVMVSGFSGAGKTTFIEESIHQRIIQKGGLFLPIKFDINQLDCGALSIIQAVLK